MPDAATTAWVAAVITNGGTVSAGRQTIVDNLIVGLKADGIWAKLERLWVYAAENQPSALTDMVADENVFTVGNSPAFTIDVGYTGANVASNAPFIETIYNPNGSSIFTQTSAHYSIWIATNIAATQGGPILGQGAGSATNFYCTYLDGNVYCRINDNPQSGSQGPPSTKVGHWVASRTGASADILYQSGAVFANINAGSTSVVNSHFLILSDAGAQGNPNTVSVFSVGGGLTGTDVANFYNRLNTYMLALVVLPPSVFDAVGRTIFKLRPRGWAW